MPRYDVFLEGRTENSTCYFGVAVMADDQKEAEFIGHEAGRRKHRECDEIEVISVRLRQAGKRRLCQCVPLKERALNLVKEAIKDGINKLLDANFTQEDMEYIYTYLGNGIKHELCMKFVQSGYDLGVIDEGLQAKDGQA